MVSSRYSGTSLACCLFLAGACSGTAHSDAESGNTVDTACPGGGCAPGQKCTGGVVAGVATPRCMRAGDVPPGEACGGNMVDDCAAGSLCGFNGVVGSAHRTTTWPQGVCQPYCASDADCKATGGIPGSRCMGFAASCEGNPMCGANLPGGICVERCTQFGDSCGELGTCASRLVDVDGETVFYACHNIGPGAPGDTCIVDTECGANMGCRPGAKCVQLCDADHDCPSGQTCTMAAGESTGECG